VRDAGAEGWVALRPVVAALSATGAASEKIKSDVLDRVRVAAGESAGTADAGAFVDEWAGGALGSEAKFVDADSPPCPASGASDRVAFVCGRGSDAVAPARPTLVDIFPARRATTAASTIPAATITMTNIS
jgi:hypothetical protein